MKLITYDCGDRRGAGGGVEEQVRDAATLLGERSGLRDVRALLEVPNDPLTRINRGSKRAGIPRC
jgi:hypothetical protein